MTARDEGAGTMGRGEEVSKDAAQRSSHKLNEYVRRAIHQGEPESYHQRLMRLGAAKDYAGILALLRSDAPVSAPGMDRGEGIRGPHEPARVEEIIARAEGLRGVDMPLDAGEIADTLRALSTEIADLKSSVIAFCAPWAVTYARDHGLPPNHLYPTHYDLLERGGRRMVDFIRVDIAGQKVTSLADGSQVEPITTGAGRHIPLESPPFIQWNGGENPAPGKRVDVKFRVGECGMDGEAAG